MIFENESNVKLAKEYFLVDIQTLRPDNLLSFYNSNCDYHVLEGTVVRKGYRAVLEEAIEEVHKDLTVLWKQYGLSFEEYLHYDERTTQNKQREIFFRGILTGKTKKDLVTSFKGRRISSQEEYRVGYDYDKGWPVLEYEQYEVSNNSSRVLLEYIIKNTEKVLRDHLGMNYNFKFDESKLYELFPVKLFRDNYREYVIEYAIIKAAERACKQHGLM